MAAIDGLPGVPAPSVKVLNDDGTMSKEWRLFFTALIAALRKVT